jgi:hypothetical protein
MFLTFSEELFGKGEFIMIKYIKYKVAGNRVYTYMKVVLNSVLLFIKVYV